MPRTHPADTTRIAYRIKPPAVWRAIRAEWEAGAIPVDLARRFDVSASSVQARRDREGWNRDGMPPPTARLGGAASAEAGAPVSALEVNEIALGAALRALAFGRAEEAVALAWAGDRVACFAAHVAGLRAEAAGGGAEPSPPPAPTHCPLAPRR